MSWEYHVEKFDYLGAEFFQQDLNLLGNDGWELIDIKWFHHDDGVQVHCVFKREC